ADRNRSHWSTSKTPSYTKSVSWHHYRESHVHVYSFTLSATVVLTRLAFKRRYDVLSKALTLII
ncbi:hypothetical protein M8N42_21190, partial [Enterobacter asburiae]|uniref:hypothetical protein n=1 Tax=Enterobacter asburiae TaxID=61645 RepID=UPI0020758CD4